MSFARRFAYSSSMAALKKEEKESDARNDTRYGVTHLSFQKLRSSSMVLAEPRILANNTSTPASLGPQKALQ